MSTILVTGGSGFVGSQLILQLLAAGHQVHTTVRNLKREPDLRAMLRTGGAEPGERLRCFAAELERDAGWREAAAGCEWVHHVASPFPTGAPKHEDELVVPAREGTLRVLRAAREAGAKRVVITSSFAAVGYGHPPQSAPFTEADWTDVNGADVQPYMKSKTLAERAAWNFVTKEGGGLELAVVNPVGVFGPVLGPRLSTSVSIVQRMLEGRMPFCPRIYFGVVDVRDVADLHIRAMTHPAAKSERFLAVAGGSMSLLDMATALRRRLGPAARQAPRFQPPDWLVRFLAAGIRDLRPVVPQLGKFRSATGEKARRLLGWAPRGNEECVAATGESLVRLGLLKGGR
jgi:dihydroflavonol-4-reductase